MNGKSGPLDRLNEEQIKSVEHTDGPLLIVAGAGTGKTSVITSKAAYLIEKGYVKSDEILALTFTDRAAAELEERIDILLPYGYFDLWASTFHSFCERILRLHAIDIGLPGNFKILTSSEQWIFLRKNLSKLELDYYRPLGNPSKFLHALITHFSRLKDENISPLSYLEYAQNLKLSSDQPDLPQELEAQRLLEVANAYNLYNNLLLENNFLDFGDLIVYAIKLFQARPQILEKYREQFKYILVDEFQDTNHAQYDLVKLLAFPKNNLTVVGDDEQSIYKFRGAALSNILEFRRDFSEAKTIVLKKNYRSCGNILNLAYNFIKLNDPNRLEARFKDDPKFPIDKKLEPQVGGDAEIDTFIGQNKYQEVNLAVQKILGLKSKDKDSTWSDFAILTRSNDAAASFALGLEKARIPHQFLAARGLYLKPIILDVINFFKLLDDYHESTAVSRLLLSPVFNISSEGMVSLTGYSKRKGCSLYESLKNAPYIKLSKDDSDIVNRFLALTEKYGNAAKEKTVSEIFLGFLEDSRYIEFLNKQDEGYAREALSYLNQFWEKIKKFEEMSFGGAVKEFCDLLAWESEAGDTGQLRFDVETGPDMVRVMTVHSAKGLEFKYVFIGQVADKRFPSVEKSDLIDIPDALVREIVTEGDIHLEEERRLFYVAMTRAKKGLFFSWAYDYGGTTRKKPSRFLHETGLVKKAEETEGEDKSEEGGFRAFSKPSEKQESPYVRMLPAHISFSQIKAFETCPLQYKFANILRIPVRGKPVFTFGQTMHTALQKFFELVLLRKLRTQAGLFGEKKLTASANIPVTVEELIKIYKESWSDDWLGDEEQKQKFYKDGLDMLKLFYKKLEEEGVSQIYALERSFRFELDGIKVIGKVDRIDKLKDGSLRLVDYKTGESKEKLSADDRQQLLIYQAAMETLGEKIGELRYHYLNDSSTMTFLGTKEEIDGIKEYIKNVVVEIRHSDFSAAPSVWKCTHCDFRNICEFRAV